MDFINNKYLKKIWVKQDEKPPMERKISVYEINLDNIYEDKINLIIPEKIKNNNISSNEPFPFFMKKNLLESFNSKYSYNSNISDEENEKLKEEIENMIDEIETKKNNLIEKERLEKERQEKERLEKERQEKERLEKEKLEWERIERERQNLERLEQERIEKEKDKTRKRVLNEILEKEKLIEKERKEKMIRDINDKYEHIKNDLPEPFYLDEQKLEKLKNSDNDKCLICQEEFKIKSQVLYFPCLHLFHSSCIMRWLLEKTTCPICLVKYDLNIDKEDERQLLNDHSKEENIINNNKTECQNFLNYSYNNTNYFRNNINNMYVPNSNIIVNYNNIYGPNSNMNINYYNMNAPIINMNMHYFNTYLPNNNMNIPNQNSLNWNMRGNWRGGKGRGNYRGGAKRDNNRNYRGNYKGGKARGNC